MVKTEDGTSQLAVKTESEPIDYKNFNLSKLAQAVKGQDYSGMDEDEKLQKKEDMALVFELRQTLPKKYNVAMCHGSRLICDADVYDKKFKLI